MKFVQRIVQYFRDHATRKNTAVVLTSVMALTVIGLFVPNQERVTNASDNIVCSNGPTDGRAHLNTFPVKWNGTNTPTQNSDGTYTCYDFPFMVGRNMNGSFPTSQSQHQNGVNVQVGDVVQIRLYIHNTAPANGPASTDAQNVTVDTSYTNGVGTATVRADAHADNVSENPSGSVKVNLPANAKLSLIPNSGVIQHYNGSYGRTNFQIGDNSVNLFSDLEGCFEKSKFVYYKFNVVQDIVPGGDLQITKDVRNVTRNGSFADQAIASVNDSLEYRIRVTAQTAAVNNITVIDTGVSGVTMTSGSLRLNGQTVSGNLSNGISIGNLNAGSSATITYSARLTSAQCNATLVNTARASAPGVTQVQDTATVITECDDNEDLPPVCVPSSQNRAVNETAFFNATNGNGSFTWSAPGSSNPTGTGSSFQTSYSTSGTKTVTVTSGGLTDTCTVIVTQVILENPICIPDTQTRDINETAFFNATNGNGSFTWSAPGSSNVSGTGSSFQTSYSTSGTKTVTVTSNGRTDTCTVVVRPDIPNQVVCVPGTQTRDINELATFNATGGNGSFTWSANGGNPSTGTGSNFSTRYATIGTKTVTVTSNGQSDTCTVFVQDDFQPVICTPDTQTRDINELATFTAVGGNGSFVWTANGGNPSNGTRSSFSTRYSSAGTKFVTVTSNGQSDTCTVFVQEEDRAVICVPDFQEVRVDERVFFNATGGNGSFTWSASGGNPSSGTGSSFNTRYSSEGLRTVSVTSGDRTDFCSVRVRDDNNDDDEAELDITKSVRNITKGGSFRQSVEAEDNDRIQFEIIVENIGDETAEDVILRDIFPDDELELDEDSVRVDGDDENISSDSNFSIDLGDLEEGEEVRITFEARVNTNDDDTIRNVARASADNADTVEDDAFVRVDEDNNDDDVELVLSKRVRNERTGQDGTNVNAERGDYLTYTLTVRNTGTGTENNFDIVDNLSGILAFAEIVDTNGGRLRGDTITWEDVDIRRGQTVTKTFRVRIKTNLSSNQSFVLDNTYGNSVTVTVPGFSSIPFIAPKTGSSGTSAAVFAGLITSGFVAFRKRRELMSLIFV